MPYWLWSLWLFVSSAAAWAQTSSLTVQAQVQATQLGLSETVVYTVELIGVTSPPLRTPDPPHTRNLSLLQPLPAVQRYYTLVDGRIQQRLRYTWRFRPIQPGLAWIGPTQLTVGEQTLATEPIELTIVPAATASPMNEPVQEPLLPHQLFIEAYLTPANPYEQQQVVLEYRLFFHEGLQVWRSRMVGSWETQGFWREELHVDDRPLPERVLRNGQPYYTFVLKRVALFPTRSGTLRIDPFVIESEVARRPDPLDPFAAFFSGPTQVEHLRLEAPAQTVHVRPLPPNAPTDFSGAVGRFRLEAAAHPTTVHVGEPVTLTLRLSGSGNLATLTLPPPSVDTTFAIYAAGHEITYDRQKDQLYGIRTQTYTLVPRAAGRFELPPVRLHYFDPESQTFRALEATLPPLRVTAAPEEASPATPSLTSIPTASPTPNYRWAFYSSLGLLALLVLALLLYRTHRPLRQNYPLSQTFDLPSPQLSPRAFYPQLDAALRRAISRYLGENVRGLSHAQLKARLERQGLPSPTLQHLLRLLVTCEILGYAPHTTETARMQHYQEALSLLQSLKTPSVQE